MAGRLLETGVKAVQGDTRSWQAVNDYAERHGVNLPEPAPLDDTLTPQEEAGVEDHFVAWAIGNPERAFELLKKLQPQMPKRDDNTRSVVRILDPARPHRRRVDFRFAQLPIGPKTSLADRDTAS